MELISLSDTGKSGKRSHANKRSPTDGYEGRESNTGAYDALSIYSDISEAVSVIDGLRDK